MMISFILVACFVLCVSLYVSYSVFAANDRIKATYIYEKATEDVLIGDLHHFRIRKYVRQTRLSDVIFDKTYLACR